MIYNKASYGSLDFNNCSATTVGNFRTSMEIFEDMEIEWVRNAKDETSARESFKLNLKAYLKSLSAKTLFKMWIKKALT